MSRRRCSARRGFTLIETMVALLVVSVVAAMAVAFFGNQPSRRKLDGFALELRALLHGARQTALSTGHQVVVMVFPNQAADFGATGRIITYEDGDFDFFSAAAGVNFGTYDPTKSLAGPRSQVLDTVDLPAAVTIGPATGQGTSAAMPAPFDGIPINVACAFCTGANGRGAVVFAPDGTATFQSGNGPALALLKGGSLSLTADRTTEVRTIAISASTGTLQTLRWSPTP